MVSVREGQPHDANMLADMRSQIMATHLENKSKKRDREDADIDDAKKKRMETHPSGIQNGNNNGQL